VTGLAFPPASTLADRALALLRTGPQPARALARDVLGLDGATEAIAERLAAALLGADPRVRQLPDGCWAAVAEALGSPLLDDCAFAVVDVETTGMRAAVDDRITEIAVVVVQGARREVVLDTLVNPGRPIPAVITGITGITDAMVAAAPPFEVVADAVAAALAGRVFVAHNARFDWGFVDHGLRRARGVLLSGSRLCTVRLARRLVPGLRSAGLDALIERFQLEMSARHRAAGDALATADLLQRLLGLAREKGARTLSDIEAMAGART
jgi:DNA polymerase-3 subunit epsilon